MASLAMAELFNGKSIGIILDENRGGPGFDWCRLGLSISVVFFHSYDVAYGLTSFRSFAEGPLAPILLAILPMFFCLSGFLVAGSALRLKSTRTFVVFRILRIAPALIVEVTLSALVLGPLVTSLPLREYFSDYQLYEYFGNVIGRVRYHLPGVFEELPSSGFVNRSLWTLHPELECYVLMSALMICGLAFRKNGLTVAWATTTTALAVYNFLSSGFETSGTYAGPVLVYYFSCGVIAYQWRYRIPANGLLFAVAGCSAYVLLKLPQTVFLAPPFVVYATLWLGMQKFPKIHFLQNGDYSYGIYLYSYPIQQTIAFAFPQAREWWIVFPLSLIASILVAVMSWHAIEKPALKLKTIFRLNELSSQFVGAATRVRS